MTALNEQPAAWLLTGSAIWRDCVFVTEEAARDRLDGRSDASFIVPLYRRDDDARASIEAVLTEKEKA